MSEYEVIPQEAIDHLIANPEKAEGFDRVFGKGRAEEVFANQNPVPDPVEVDEDMGFIETMWDASGRAILHGAQEAVNETVDAVESFDIWVSNKLDGLGVKSRLQLFEINEDGSAGPFNPTFKYYHETLGDRDMLGGTVGEKGDAAELNVVQAPETVVGGLVSGVSQFAAGYLMAGKFTKLAGLRGAFVNGAIADALVFDPNDPNVMGMIEHFGVDTGALGEALATDPDDPEYINRLRNVAEGVIAGGLVEAIGWSIRASRARMAGNSKAAQAFTEQQEAALKEFDDALADSAKEVISDAEKSMDLSKRVFDDALPATDDVVSTRVESDGQLSLNTGDTPRHAPVVADLKKVNPNRIFLTPEKVEKIRLQSALAAGAPRKSKQEMFSFRSLTTVTDFEDVLDDIAGAKAGMAEDFTKIKGGNVQRWTTVKLQAAAKLRQMAEMTGEDPEALVRKFMTADMGDSTKLAAEIHARSKYLLTVEEELKKMAKAITTGAFDPREFPGIRDLDHLRMAFVQRREVAANLLAGHDALRTNVARAMNAMKIAVKGDESLRNMLKDPSVFHDVDAAARAVADPANAGESAIRTITDALSKVHGYMDDVNTFRINALLSGPGTQEVNFISNVLNSFVIPAEQFLGGTARFAVTGDNRMMIHATRQIQGYVAGLLDSVGTALKAGWFDDAILDPHSMKVEEARGIRTTGLFPQHSTTGKAVRLPSRALMTMDEFFKQAQYRGRVFADANEEATKKGLKGGDRTDFVKQYLKDSYDESGAALRGDALLQARRATFTEPLEGGLPSMIQMAAIKYPAIRFIVPFVRTPINLLSQTFQHVPIAGALSKRWQADIAAGGARQAQAIGRWITGAGVIAGAGYMAANGIITGSGPSDPRIRKVWLRNNQPYAFRVENEDGTVTWVSYARFEPLSNLLSIAADMVEIANDEFNEAETRGILEAVFMATMENSVNKTFTQGIYDFMSIMVGNKQYEREAALRNMLASFVPNAWNQLNGDETLREARSLTDAILSRTHKYNQVDPKRNVLGEPIVRRLPKYDPLGLTHKDRREVDTVLEEVTRVAILNQSVADNPARRVPGPNRIDLATVPYAEGQSLYDRWVELTGEVKIGGLTLREKLAETFESRSYKTAPDGFIGATSGTKGARIRKIIASYREKAKSELPELVEIIQSERRGGGNVLREQARSNRELFPLTNTPERSIKRRTFEDLLGR